MDEHLSAQISLIGMLFDAAGGLFLAYDLLGGEKGPLSTFTRVFTYSVMGVFLYGLTMGLRFGLIVGVSLGGCLGLHLDRLGRDKPDTKSFLVLLGLTRAFGLSAAVWLEGHPLLAVVAFVVVFILSMLLPLLKLGPAMLIESTNRPTINRKKVGFSILLGVLVLCTDLICVSIGGLTQYEVSRIFRLSLTVVMATLIIATISPMIEWYADHVEPKVLGYLGTILFILGFLMQAFPSLVTVLS